MTVAYFDTALIVTVSRIVTRGLSKPAVSYVEVGGDEISFLAVALRAGGAIALRRADTSEWTFSAGRLLSGNELRTSRRLKFLADFLYPRPQHLGLV